MLANIVNVQSLLKPHILEKKLFGPLMALVCWVYHQSIVMSVYSNSPETIMSQLVAQLVH